MKKILLVAGARPNFMKIAPIIRELRQHSDRFQFRLVHTGQHYDKDMSEVFFEELEIPQPDHYLEVGSGSHAEQTGKIMLRFEKVCESERPDLVIVVGDINSTLACAIVAKKQNILLAHVEAGLRSRDLAMPEEINRMVTDAISDLFFVTERSGVENLRAEGKAPGSLFFVGHVMVDNLFHQLERLQRDPGLAAESSELKRRFPRYGVVTLHRPANVDDAGTLSRLAAALSDVSRYLPLIFPIHPRTHASLERHGIRLPTTIEMIKPLGYLGFLDLFRDARLVLTDSGGIQEETTALGVPCLTLRENTERPITVEEGTNTLVGTDPGRILDETVKILQGHGKTGRRPELWDGRAAQRIVGILGEKLGDC